MLDVAARIRGIKLVVIYGYKLTCKVQYCMVFFDQNRMRGKANDTAFLNQIAE
jgi:hypothetical protein